MKGTAEALKDAGIEFVVLLSSNTIGHTPQANVVAEQDHPVRACTARGYVG
jgi:hypothetical protein